MKSSLENTYPYRHKDKKDSGRFTRAKASTLGEDYTKKE